jgi:LacI family transcriptional regulator
VVPTLGISIFAEGIEALQNRLSEHGYMLLLANSQYDPSKELQEVRTLLERGVDGIVLVGDASSPKVHELIRQYDVPVVITYVARFRFSSAPTSTYLRPVCTGTGERWEKA